MLSRQTKIGQRLIIIGASILGGIVLTMVVSIAVHHLGPVGIVLGLMVAAIILLAVGWILIDTDDSATTPGWKNEPTTTPPPFQSGLSTGEEPHALDQ